MDKVFSCIAMLVIQLTSFFDVIETILVKTVHVQMHKVDQTKLDSLKLQCIRIMYKIIEQNEITWIIQSALHTGLKCL